MAKYRLLIKPSAVKEIEESDRKSDRRRVVERIQSLADDPRPHGSQKLSGQERYRVRQGRSRIAYAIDDADVIVYVVKVAHRKDVYR